MLKTVFMTSEPVQAELARALLRDHGIPSFLENEHSHQMGLSFQAPQTPLLVKVHEAQEAEALALLRTRPRPALPRFVVMSCASCGRTLEMPEGEDAPDECPWCGKPPG